MQLLRRTLKDKRPKCNNNNCHLSERRRRWWSRRWWTRVDKESDTRRRCHSSSSSSWLYAIRKILWSINCQFTQRWKGDATTTTHTIVKMRTAFGDAGEVLFLTRSNTAEHSVCVSTFSMLTFLSPCQRPLPPFKQGGLSFLCSLSRPSSKVFFLTSFPPISKMRKGEEEEKQKLTFPGVSASTHI